jgi:hypothetical protein
MDREQIDYITAVKAMPEQERYSKLTLNVLKRIKVAETGMPDRECFCSQLRRKIWYKEFINWYEGNS